MPTELQRQWIQVLGRLAPPAAVQGGPELDAGAASARVEGAPHSSPGAVRLAGSVGAQGRNAEADVRLVQAALNRRASARLVEDGVCGVATIGAIVAFQKGLGHQSPDGRIDPGGPTERALNGHAVTPPGAADAQRPAPRAPVEHEDLRGGAGERVAEPDFRRLAQRIHAAAEGLGTDEDAIFAALRELGGSPANRVRLGQVYRELFGEDLEAVLRDELGADERERAEEAARQRGGPDFAALARQIHAAAAGVGTDERAIQAALAQVSGRPEHMARLRETYRALFGANLDDVLRDELSGADLRQAENALDARREEIRDRGFDEADERDREGGGGIEVQEE
jgi:peptidoglycan hydrolase-like protein with peptidoglycan-binding domain